MSDYKRKYEEMVREVGERVRCPICLDIPTAGPVYSCPRGHCVCAACYQGDASRCPVCRASMSGMVSLVAASVIETMEHRCQFEAAGCLGRMAVGQAEAHAQACGFRTVTCPSANSDDCDNSMALALLPDHLLKVFESL